MKKRISLFKFLIIFTLSPILLVIMLFLSLYLLDMLDVFNNISILITSLIFGIIILIDFGYSINYILIKRKIIILDIEKKIILAFFKYSPILFGIVLVYMIFYPRENWSTKIGVIITMAIAIIVMIFSYRYIKKDFQIEERIYGEE